MAFTQILIPINKTREVTGNGNASLRRGLGGSKALVWIFLLLWILERIDIFQEYILKYLHMKWQNVLNLLQSNCKMHREGIDHTRLVANWWFWRRVVSSGILRYSLHHCLWIWSFKKNPLQDFKRPAAQDSINYGPAIQQNTMQLLKTIVSNHLFSDIENRITVLGCLRELCNSNLSNN